MRFQELIIIIISLIHAYPGCGRPTLNFIECFELGRTFLDSIAGLILFGGIHDYTRRAHLLRDVM